MSADNNIETGNKAWQTPMPSSQFDFMSKVLAAPSPIGFEAAMTYGVIKPEFESFMPEGWAVHQFKGNAGLVFDSHPGRDDLVSVMIVGHADSRDTREYNMQLSLRRAQRVADYIKSHAIPVERIELSAMGEMNPASTNTTPRGRALNRRTWVKVVF